MWRSAMTTSFADGFASSAKPSQTEPSSRTRPQRPSTTRSRSSKPLPWVTMSWESPTAETTATMMVDLSTMMKSAKKAFFKEHPTWGIGFEVSAERKPGAAGWLTPWTVRMDLWPEPHPAMPDELLD